MNIEWTPIITIVITTALSGLIGYLNHRTTKKRLESVELPTSRADAAGTLADAAAKLVAEQRKDADRKLQNTIADFEQRLDAMEKRHKGIISVLANYTAELIEVTITLHNQLKINKITPDAEIPPIPDELSKYIGE